MVNICKVLGSIQLSESPPCSSNNGVYVRPKDARAPVNTPTLDREQYAGDRLSGAVHCGPFFSHLIHTILVRPKSAKCEVRQSTYVELPVPLFLYFQASFIPLAAPSISPFLPPPPKKKYFPQLPPPCAILKPHVEYRLRCRQQGRRLRNGRAALQHRCEPRVVGATGYALDCER